MLFQQADVGHGHASVNRLAHVVNRQQGHLQGGEGFHFYAGGADGFGRHGAHDTIGLGTFGGAGVDDVKLHGDPRQGQRVAQRNEFAGLFGRHDGGHAGNAQHIAFFGAATFNQLARGGQHLDAAARNGNAVRVGFAADIDHMGLALGVKVGDSAHGVGG